MPTIHVNASAVVNRVSREMYGSCIEDVNHEIYGGLYAQQIFGESFEEPPTGAPMAGWNVYGGQWTATPEACTVESDAGAKLVREMPDMADGTVACDIRLNDAGSDNAGLILRVSDPRTGPNTWNGYEVSLGLGNGGYLRLGRHRNDWQLFRDVATPILPNHWYRLKVVLAGPTLRIFLNADPHPILETTDTTAPILAGRVGVRTWNSLASFRALTIETADGKQIPGFPSLVESEQIDRVSGMWQPVRTGDAIAHFDWDAVDPYNTAHSQKIEMRAGTGTVGVANRGLNGWGLTVRRGRRYEGRLYLRQSGYSGKVIVALQSADGSRTYAQQSLGPLGAQWAGHDFALRADATDTDARFTVWIDQPGAVWVDQVTLMPTGSERFRGLPLRADIGNALVEQGLTVLRYGGTMVNAPEYRWKQMIGARDRRPQYRGHWYPHSTNGFGIEEFVQFCRAARFEPVFAINIEETPEDAADLVEYLNGPATSPWGRRRAENGHPEPYQVRSIEIGNEETTNAHYLERFLLLEAAMHRRDPSLQLIIAAWWEPDNPVSRQIVQTLNGKAALWDVHIGGDGLHDGDEVDRLFTRMTRLFQEWAPNTSMKACVLEENGGLHNLQRALGHAHILNTTERHGDFVRIDCPANCLQPWKQNNNGWDQGQVFFTSGQVWGMPPFYAQQMAAANYLPLRVESGMTPPDNDLDVTATRSEDGKTLVLKVVNLGPAPQSFAIQLEGFSGVHPEAETWTLTGDLSAINTPEAPEAIRSHRAVLTQAAERFDHTFPAYSYTVLRLHR